MIRFLEGVQHTCQVPAGFAGCITEKPGPCGTGPDQASANEIFTGHSVKIPSETRLRDCVIWDNSRIGSNSCFENVIIAGTSGVLPDGMEVKDAVITPSLADIHAVMPANAETGPGYIIWPLNGFRGLISPVYQGTIKRGPAQSQSYSTKADGVHP